MSDDLKQNLINEYKRAFSNTFEAGGGYGFRYDHGVRVMTYCERFLELPYFKGQQINKEAVIIAALFADIGKVAAVDEEGELIYGSKGDLEHAEVGAKMVRQYLVNHIKNGSLIESIAAIIEEQHHKGQKTLESKIVKDADRFDNYGFLQIWRHVTYAHYDKRGIGRLREFWVDEKANEKAKDYLEKFNFTVIKGLATKRYEKLDYLIGEIDRETRGEDINIYGDLALGQASKTQTSTGGL